MAKFDKTIQRENVQKLMNRFLLKSAPFHIGIRVYVYFDRLVHFHLLLCFCYHFIFENWRGWQYDCSIVFKMKFQFDFEINLPKNLNCSLYLLVFVLNMPFLLYVDTRRFFVQFRLTMVCLHKCSFVIWGNETLICQQKYFVYHLND